MNHSSTQLLSFVQLAATAIFVTIGMSIGTIGVASTQMQNAFWWTPQAHNYATAFLTPIPLHVKLLSNASSNAATSSFASLQSASNIMEFTMLDICTADAAESGICVACALSATNPASHKLLPTEAAGNFNDSSVNVSILSLLQCVALYGPKLCEGLANGILYSFNGLSSVVATNELSLLFPRFCDCSICRPAPSNFNTTATFSDSELAISLLSTALASISDVSGYSLAGRPIIELAFSADIALNPNTLLTALTISEAVGQEVSDWTEAVFGAQQSSLAVWADYRTLLIALPTVPLPLSTSTDTILSALQDLPFSSLSFYGFPSLHPLPPSVLSVSQLSCSTSNYFLASSRLCVSCGVGAVSFGGLSPGCTCDAAHGYVGIWSAVPPYCQLSKDSSLQTLLVTGGVLSPPFATNAVRQMYTVLIANNGNLAVTAVAAAGASITLSTVGSIPPFNLTAMNDINGVLVPLVTGQTTTVSVNVLAADGIHQSMYFINATKESSTTTELALLLLLSLNLNCSLVSTDSALITFKSELVNELSAFLQADISRFIITSLQCGSIDVTLAIQPGAPSSPSQLYGQLLAALYSGALANSTFTLLQRTTELQVLGFVAPVSAGNAGEKGGGSGLSTQASIGIGVGVGVGGALLLLILLLLFCKFRNQIRSQTSVKDVKGEQMTTTGPELQKEGRTNESGDEKRSPSPSVNVVKLHTETGVQLATIVVASNTSADSTARQTDGSK